MYTDYQAETYFLQDPDQLNASARNEGQLSGAEAKGEVEVTAWRQAAGSGPKRPPYADSLT
jgi:hypothetical protein